MSHSTPSQVLWDSHYVPGSLVKRDGVGPPNAAGLSALLAAADAPRGVILSAGSGAGKSIEGWKAFLDCLTDDEIAYFGGLRLLQTPLPYLPCRGTPDGGETVALFLKRLSRLRPPPDVESLDAGPPLLLLVELDPTRAGDGAAFVRFLNDHPDDGHRVVLFQRSTGTESTPPGFGRYELADWDDGQIADYTRALQPDAPTAVDAVAALGRTPLIISLLLDCQHEPSVPLTLTRLFHRVVDRWFAAANCSEQRVPRAMLTRLALADEAFGDNRPVCEAKFCQLMHLPADCPGFRHDAVARWRGANNAALVEAFLAPQIEACLQIGFTRPLRPSGHEFVHDSFKAFFAGIHLRQDCSPWSGDPGPVDGLPGHPDLWQAVRVRVQANPRLWEWSAAFFAGTLSVADKLAVVACFFEVETPEVWMIEFLLTVCEDGERLAPLRAVLRDHRLRLAPEAVYTPSVWRDVVAAPGRYLDPMPELPDV